MKIKLFSSLLLALLAILPSYSSLEAREHCHGCNRPRTNFSIGFSQPRPAPQVYLVETPPVYVERAYVRPNRPYYNNYAQPVVIYEQPRTYYEEVVVYPQPRPQSSFSFSWMFGR
jgi:hypothetical protein